MKTYFLLASMLFFLIPFDAEAQFYTVSVDSMRVGTHPLIKVKERKAQKEFDSLEVDSLEQKAIPPTLRVAESPSKRGKGDTSRSSGEERINPLLSLLEERLNVCLPLDFLRVSSRFGHRIDPITQCKAFHDGVDLVCKHENVYAMLPAVVKKVHKGNKGYGNYVILNHGKLECLYGHLDEITVREKEVINAGTIVGISGNTGKSTGYHLHIRLRNEGKSVDPSVFIGFLKAYIAKLNTQLSNVVEPNRDEEIAFSLRDVYEEIVKHNIKFPHIVLSQAVLETGHFSSRVCLEYNNLFGLRKRNGEYYRFSRWEDSVKAYRDYVQYKYRGGNYFDFLQRIGYAEDKLYVGKVMEIAKGIKQKIENS